MLPIPLFTRPDKRQLRNFSLVGLVFGLGLGLWFALRAPSAPLRSLSAVIGGLLFPLSFWVAPRVLFAFLVALNCLTYPIRFATHFLALAVLFYLVFWPVGIVLRVLSKSPLQLRPSRDPPSYWLPYGTDRSTESYFNQF